MAFGSSGYFMQLGGSSVSVVWSREVAIVRTSEVRNALAKINRRLSAGPLYGGFSHLGLGGTVKREVSLISWSVILLFEANPRKPRKNE